jgi:hypothetical protein
MIRLFLPKEEISKIMLQDKIVFRQEGNNPETVDFYRGDEKISFNHFLYSENKTEPLRRLTQAERVRIAKIVAIATRTKLRTLEWGEKITIFQFI